jgi:hypothetical protein
MKIIPMIVVGMIVLSGLGAVAFSTDVSMKKASTAQSESASVVFSSPPSFSEKDGFVEVTLAGATTFLSEPNRPVLPLYVRTFEIPFGSTNLKVACTPREINTMAVSKEIAPARIAPLSKMKERTAYVKDAQIYGSAAFYPAQWYTTELGAGRNYADIEVVFVKIICSPLRYSPGNSQIIYTNGFDVTLTYQAPLTAPHAAATSDMVVIAPKTFKTTLQPLIDFKNRKGVNTTFMSIEDIFAKY